MIVGIGADIIEIDRMKRAVERSQGRIAQRLFTEREAAYCARHKNQFQHYAGRFAAKEAAFKALGTGWSGGIAWRDVEVQNAPSGKPSLVLHGRAKEIGERLGVTAIHLTISHSDRYALAQVILERMKDEG